MREPTRRARQHHVEREFSPAPPTQADTLHEFTVEVPRVDSYAVVVEVGLMRRYGALLRDTLAPDAVYVLTDRRVAKLYGAAMRESLTAAGLRQKWLEVAEGERSKSLAAFTRTLDQLAALGCARRSLLLAFGGGVISDLGGYVAASFMRGIRYANFATSLIGQVDASVGGKVAVNGAMAKNLYGAFHHPSHVGADPTLLRTLSERDFRSGMAEAIKVAILDDSLTLAELLERQHARARARDPYALAQIVALAARLKMDWIGRDPYERDLRRPLNLGHTIGHPIETAYQYKRIRHGEAVAIGVGVATCLSLRRRLIAETAAERIFALLQRYGLLGFWEPVRAELVFEHMAIVRRIRGNHLNFVLPTKVGAVHITDDVDRAALAQAFDDYEDVVARLAPRSRPPARKLGESAPGRD